MANVDKEKIHEWKSTYDGMSYPDMGRRFIELKDQISALDQTKKLLSAEFDYLRLSVIPDKMEEDEMSSINIKGLGRLGLTMDAYVSVSAENREKFYEWLEENGHGGMVKPYAQPGTVKAWAKDMYKRGIEGEDGCELPESLVSVEPFMRASLTKK